MLFSETVSCRIALEHLHSCLLSLNTEGEAAYQFRHLALGALKALEGLHTEKSIHRDVKLENFAVRKDAVSGELEVCLIDFGLLLGYTNIQREGEHDTLKYIGKVSPFLASYLFTRRKSITVSYNLFLFLSARYPGV